MSLPSTRPASFAVTDAEGTEHLCSDCLSALKRRGTLPHASIKPLVFAEVVATEPAPDGAVCVWCE